MYWADWGNHPKIETAAMDGTMRETLVEENIQWPTGKTIRSYWPFLARQLKSDKTVNGEQEVSRRG